MSKLAKELDVFFNRILVLAEHQNELLLGHCQSDLELTNTQEHILMLLSHERLTNSDLAKRLKVSQAAVTKAVKAMIRQELLETHKDDSDARISYYSLTDAAKAVALEHDQHHQSTLAVYDEILSSFSTSEQAVIGRFINNLEKGFDR
ncbi:zinc-dependent MarR family transcriptional regulator [Streptococcus downei]|uniref:MarR family transcriptional regulator n=1 Tax=Streptococcus downei MFe28 TaxID=764290 RepID=A0A380JBV4_STRDO|nr:zinc-dependent MarR family transcriptional regulator [Streptococcus downei]EFQ57125.1 transcriptional regulator, MarR family [Streptococcus downei F0415]SUN35491.1 MarR family transcriptional regulator [Streptococcus downei MFe28]